MPNPVNPRPATATVLIFLHVLLGLNGIAGGGAFVLAPDGRLMQMPLSELRSSPFSSFLIPGMLLFVFLGVYPLAVAYCLWKRPRWNWPEALDPFRGLHWSWAGSLATGAIAMLWILVQIQWIQPSFLQALIFGWGVLITILTLARTVRQYYTREG